MSPRPGNSTLITSAPSHARIWVAEGPAWTWLMSRTRMPSSALRSGISSGLPFFAIVAYSTRLLVHGLVHRTGSERVLVDPDVDQRRKTRSASALERRAN